MKRNNKKGFTIVELVIVIAVIGILAGVMIPVFGSVIDDANKNAAQQQARNGYTQCFSADLADGEVDGSADGTAIADTSYSVSNGTATYTATKGNWTASFNGSTMTLTEN